MSGQRVSSAGGSSSAVDERYPAREAFGTFESVERKMTRVRGVLTPSGEIGDDRARDALFSWVADQMVRFGPPKTSPIVSIVHHVGNYWRNWLLMILRTGTYRPSTISRLLAALDPARHISQRILTINLRMLERDGLIERSVIDEKRRNVVYALTPLGADLSDLLLLLLEWGDQNAGAIAAARAAFDACNSDTDTDTESESESD